MYVPFITIAYSMFLILEIRLIVALNGDRVAHIRSIIHTIKVNNYFPYKIMLDRENE